MLSFSDEASKYIPDEEPKNGYDKLQEAVLVVKRMKGFHDYIKEDYNKIKLLENFSKSEKVTLNRWNSKEKAKEYRDSLALDFQEKVVNPILQQWREYCHAGIIEFILLFKTHI